MKPLTKHPQEDLQELVEKYFSNDSDVNDYQQAMTLAFGRKGEIMEGKMLAKWIYKHCYDWNDNTINLSWLDFTPYNCDVDLSFIKVSKNLKQNHMRANKIYQIDLKTTGIKMDNLNSYEVTTDGAYSTLIPKIPELTKKEIEKLLGYEIKIVDTNEKDA